LKNSSTISKKLVSSEKNIHGVIISTLHEVKVAAPIFKSANMPTLVLWDAAPEIEKMGKNFFSIGPWAPDTGATASRFAGQTLKKKRAVIIANHHDWSLTVSEVFKEDFESKGGEVLAFEVHNPETLDFRSSLLKIMSKKPDVIYAPLVFGIATFAKQLHQQGHAISVIMSDNLTDALIDSAQGALDPHYSSDFYCEWRLPNITGTLHLFSTSMCLGTLSPEKRHKAPVISDTHHSRNEV
jgi:ABC-type branched-subunit amino acid transport system substrate-binding protein